MTLPEWSRLASYSNQTLQHWAKEALGSLGGRSGGEDLAYLGPSYAWWSRLPQHGTQIFSSSHFLGSGVCFLCSKLSSEDSPSLLSPPSTPRVAQRCPQPTLRWPPPHPLDLDYPHLIGKQTFFSLFSFFFSSSSSHQLPSLAPQHTPARSRGFPWNPQAECQRPAPCRLWSSSASCPSSPQAQPQGIS